MEGIKGGGVGGLGSKGIGFVIEWIECVRDRCVVYGVIVAVGGLVRRIGVV